MSVKAYSHWSQIPPGVWKWAPEFKPSEWADKIDGSIVVDDAFMAKVYLARVQFKKAIIVHSGYRTPDHNEVVSSTKSREGAHTLGCAGDLGAAGGDALELLEILLAIGFKGIGIDQKLGTDPKGRYIHVDDAPDRPDAPRPYLWTY